MGEVRPFYIPVLFSVTFLPPHPRFVLRWRDSAGLGRLLPSPVSGHSRRVCVPARGVPPLPILVGVPPTPPPSPACHARGAHAAWGVTSLPHLGWGPPPSSLSCKPCVGSTRCLGGDPPSPSWSGGIPPSFSCMSCAESARCSGGAPPLPSWSNPPPTPPLPILNAVCGVHTLQLAPPTWLRARVARCLSGIPPLSPLPAHGLRMLLGGGSPLLLHPLAAR